MANSLQKAEIFSTIMQTKLYEAFVGKYITTTKFEGDFDGADTVHFRRQAKPTVGDLATSYSTLVAQDLVQTDETFVLDTRKYFRIDISDEDYKELDINPDSEIIKDSVEAFAKEYDIKIMSEYASAGIEIDDGDMATATNGGAGNPVILTKSNIYDLITAIAQAMDEANIADSERFVVLSPKEKRLLANAPELLRATNLGDKTVTGGFMGTVDNISIYWSNNLQTSGGIKHALAGQGKPICFAANIKPKVQFVDSSNKADSFVNTLKAQTKFGVKTFSEGAERLIDVNIKA